MTKRIYSRFGRSARWVVKNTVFRGSFSDRSGGIGGASSAADSNRSFPDEPEAAGPAVYVVHHQNLQGPVAAVALLPEEVRLWVFHVFCSREACFEQYSGYTFSQRFGWPKPAARAAAEILSRVVPGFLNSLGVIPVYRGTREIRETIRLSVDALKRGESILICPDKDYADQSGEMGEIYKGFLCLEKYYRKETGKHLDFIPLAVHKTEKNGTARGRYSLAAGVPVRFDGIRTFAEEQRSAALRLTDEINRMAEIGAKIG